MRKCWKSLVAIVLCLVMCPIMTAHADFTPSVSYKKSPRLIARPNGEIGEIVDAEGNPLSKEYESGVVITPIAEVDTSKAISESAAKELKKVYNDIVKGKTDFKKYSDLAQWIGENLGSGKTADDMVVRDIFDITEVSETLLKYLSVEGNTIDLTFDLDVSADEKVAPMVYINGKWEMAPKVVNNGDGTVTITFEHFSPVAFLVEGTGVKGDLVPVTGDNSTKDITLWVALAAVSLVAMVGVGICYRRRER